MSESSYSPSKSKYLLKKRNCIGRLDDKLTAIHSVFPKQGKIKDYTISKNQVGWNYYGGSEQKYKDTVVVSNQNLNHVECKDIMSNMMEDLKIKYTLATTNIPAPINSLVVVLNMPQIVKILKKVARTKIKTCLSDRFNKWTEVVQYIKSMLWNKKILERRSAICIQRFIRGYLAKLKAYRLAERKELLRRNRIIVIVQCAVRIFLAKKRSIRNIRLREEQRTAAMKQKHLDSAIIIQKIFRGYLLRGKLANIERILLFRDLCTWANGFANKLFDRKKLKDHPTQKLLLNAIALSFLASRPLRLLPTRKQIRIVREALHKRHTIETNQSSILRLQYIHRQLDRANMFEEDKLSNNIRRHIASVQKHEYLFKEMERIRQLREETEAKKRQLVSEIMKSTATLRAEEIIQKAENEEMFRAEYTQRRVLVAQKAIADRHRSRELELIHREHLLMTQLRRSEDALAKQQRLHIKTLSHIRTVKLEGDEMCGEGGQRFLTSILERNIRQWKSKNCQVSHKNKSGSRSNDNSPNIYSVSPPSYQNKVGSKSKRNSNTSSITMIDDNTVSSSTMTWEDELCSWKNGKRNYIAFHITRKKSHLESYIFKNSYPYSDHFVTLLGKLSQEQNKHDTEVLDKKHWWRYSMMETPPINATDHDNALVTKILSSEDFISGTDLFEKERRFISKFRVIRENNVNEAIKDNLNTSSTPHTYNSSKTAISLVPLITKVCVNIPKDALLELQLLLTLREIRYLRLIEYDKLSHSLGSFRMHHTQLLQMRELLLKGKYPTRTARKQQLQNVIDIEWTLSFYRMAIIKASKNISTFIKEELFIFIQLFLPNEYSILKKQQEVEEIKLENARKEIIQKKIDEANKLIQIKQSSSSGSSSVTNPVSLRSNAVMIGHHQRGEIHEKHPRMESATSKKGKPNNARKNPNPSITKNIHGIHKKTGRNSSSVNNSLDVHYEEEAAAVAAKSEKLYRQFTSHFKFPLPPLELWDDDALGKTSDQEGEDLMNKRKAAKKSNQPGFIAFSDEHPQLFDFFQWGESTIKWTSILAKWMTGQEEVWKQKITPRCLGFLQRLQYLISLPGQQRTENTSTSSSSKPIKKHGNQDSDNKIDSVILSDIHLIEFIHRSDAIDLLEMLTNRLQIELTVYDSVSQVTVSYSLDDKEAEIVLARHPASSLARILLLRRLYRSDHLHQNDIKIQNLMKISEEGIHLSTIWPYFSSTTTTDTDSSKVTVIDHSHTSHTSDSKHTILTEGIKEPPVSSIRSTNPRNITSPASASETDPEDKGLDTSRSTSSSRQHKAGMKGGHSNVNLRPRSFSSNSESEARSCNSDSSNSTKDSKRVKIRSAAESQTPSIHKPSMKMIKEKRKKSHAADTKTVRKKSVLQLQASLGSFYFPVDIPNKEGDDKDGDDMICNRDRIETLFQTLNINIKEKCKNRHIFHQDKNYVLHRFIGYNLDDMVLKAAYMEFIDIHHMIDCVIEKRYFEVKINSNKGTGIITQRPHVTPGIFISVNKSLQEWSVTIPRWMHPVCYWGTPAGAVPKWHRRASRCRRSTANFVMTNVLQLELCVDMYAMNIITALKERVAKKANEMSIQWMHSEREHMLFEDALSCISNYEYYYLEKDKLQKFHEEEKYKQALLQKQQEEKARESTWSHWIGSSLFGRNEVKIHSTIDADIEPKIVVSPRRLKRRNKYEKALVIYRKSVVNWPKYRQKIFQPTIFSDNLPITQLDPIVVSNRLQIADSTSISRVNNTATHLLTNDDAININKAFTWVTEEPISLSTPYRHQSLVKVQYLPPKDFTMDVKEVWVVGGLSHVMVVMRVVNDCYIAPRGHQIVEYLPGMDVAMSARIGFSDRPLCQNNCKAYAICKTSHDRYLSEAALMNISIEEPKVFLPNVDNLKEKLVFEVKSYRFSGSDECIRGIVLLQRKVRQILKFRHSRAKREF